MLSRVITYTSPAIASSHGTRGIRHQARARGAMCIITRNTKDYKHPTDPGDQAPLGPRRIVLTIDRPWIRTSQPRSPKYGEPASVNLRWAPEAHGPTARGQAKSSPCREPAADRDAALRFEDWSGALRYGVTVLGEGSAGPQVLVLDEYPSYARPVPSWTRPSRLSWTRPPPGTWPRGGGHP